MFGWLKKIDQAQVDLVDNALAWTWYHWGWKHLYWAQVTGGAWVVASWMAFVNTPDWLIGSIAVLNTFWVIAEILSIMILPAEARNKLMIRQRGGFTGVLRFSAWFMLFSDGLAVIIHPTRYTITMVAYWVTYLGFLLVFFALTPTGPRKPKTISSGSLAWARG